MLPSEGGVNWREGTKGAFGAGGLTTIFGLYLFFTVVQISSID